jgi:hypothetical protein
MFIDGFAISFSEQSERWRANSTLRRVRSRGSPSGISCSQTANIKYRWVSVFYTKFPKVEVLAAQSKCSQVAMEAGLLWSRETMMYPQGACGTLQSGIREAMPISLRHHSSKAAHLNN